MIFICKKQKLQEAIAIAQKAITGRTTNTLLEGLYLNAQNNKIKIIGSDLDLSIETYIDADVIQEGAVVIDSRIFGEIIRKLPDSEIKIEIIENETVQITCQKSVFNVVYMNPEEYPEIPAINQENQIQIPQNILKNMIKCTSFAIAQDETRPILQGILFKISNKSLDLVALDGYRLAIKSEYIDNNLEIEAVIPGKTLNEVSKILEDTDDSVFITFTNNHILFNLDNTKVISRLLEGKYINYLSLLPEEHKITVTANRQELQNGIERASLMAKDGNNNLIKLNVEKNDLIITSNSQLGKVREEVSVNVQGDDIEIAFNSRYLLDVLKNMDEDNIVIEMTSSVTPCIIKSASTDNYRYLLLPVRLVK